MTRRLFDRTLAALLPVVVASGCATTGSTFRSGVGDTFLEHAPWYAGARAGDSTVAHLPITFQPGAADAGPFEPAGDAVAHLVAEMNAYLDSLMAAPRLSRTPLAGTPPDVQFGCETDSLGDCTNGPAAPFDPGRPRMRLAVGRPSDVWIRELDRALGDAGAERALLITLEIGQYWPVQTNWRGSKAVELGTGHAIDLPWLTSLETPVTVLQLTGALVGRDGRAVRIGAEGLLARRTGIVAAGFGAQALLTDEDIAGLQELRRHDRPGQPLVWQAALHDLVRGLTGITPD